MTPSSSWLPSHQLRNPRRKRAPVSQWLPLVSRGGVSPDIFGHVLSLWPGGSSAHLQKVGREQSILVLPKSHGLKRQVGVCRECDSLQKIQMLSSEEGRMDG